MGKGSSAPATTTVNQSMLPDYVEPYFTELLDRTNSESRRDYIPYEGPRIAGDSADLTNSFDMYRNISNNGITGIGEAQDTVANSTAGMEAAIGGANAADFSQYGFQNSGTVGPTQFNTNAYDGAGTYLGDTVQQYMSPYIENVVNRQQENALENYNRQRGSRNAAAVNAGAFGGSRHGVADYLAEEGLLDRQDDIAAEGYQRAFTEGNAMFEQDRGARLGVDALEQAQNRWRQDSEAADLQAWDQRRQAEEARVQSGQAGEYGRVQAADAAEATNLRDFQMRGNEALANNANLLAELGINEGEFNRQSAVDIQSIGEYLTAREQEGLDLTYEDFVRQRDYPREQINFMSSVLRGVPVSPSTEATTIANQNPLSSIAGAGLGALGTYKALQ